LQALQRWGPQQPLQALLWVELLLAGALRLPLLRQALLQGKLAGAHHLQQTYACGSWSVRPAVVVALGLLCDVPGPLHSVHVASRLLLPARGLEVVGSAYAA
jgi:hypothetical protein